MCSLCSALSLLLPRVGTTLVVRKLHFASDMKFKHFHCVSNQLFKSGCESLLVYIQGFTELHNQYAATLLKAFESRFQCYQNKSFLILSLLNPAISCRRRLEAQLWRPDTHIFLIQHSISYSSKQTFPSNRKPHVSAIWDAETRDFELGVRRVHDE